MQRSIIAPAERVTNLRWGMLAIVATLVLAVSVDGTALVLGGWTDLDRVAFVAGAIAGQLPAGLLLDRFGVRSCGSIAGLAWILAALAATLAGPGALTAASAVAGIATSAFLPLAMKATASWFPRAERGRATAIVIVAANLPIAFALSPFAPKLADGTAFAVATGFAALATLAFAIAYRDADDARVTYAERTYIVDGGAQPVARANVATAVAYLVRQPRVWSMAFAFGAFGYAFGMGAIQIWGVAFGAVAVLINYVAGGALVDALVARGNARGRTIVLVLGTLAGCATFGIVGFSPAIGWICTAIALCGFAAAQPVAWSIPGIIAPRGTVGTVASVMALAGTIGATLAWSGGADAPGAALAALIAAACYAFAFARIESIPEPI